jgi:hypothetical protein
MSSHATSHASDRLGRGRDRRTGGAAPRRHKLSGANCAPRRLQARRDRNRQAFDLLVGSIPTGAIYRGDLKTGEGSIFIPGVTGRAAIGVEYHDGLLFVADGPTGKGFVLQREEWEAAGRAAARELNLPALWRRVGRPRVPPRNPAFPRYRRYLQTI